MKKIFLWVGIIVLMFTGLYLFGINKTEILSPLGNKKEEVNTLIHPYKSSYKITGFLPTWMVGKTVEYTDEIDKLIFLGIEVDINGKLIWDFQAKKMRSEEYQKIKKSIKRHGGKNILGIKIFKDDKIEKLINNDLAINNLIYELKILKLEQHFDGINVDFEYQGNPVKVLDEIFLKFLKKLKKANIGEISLDIFANTIIKGSVKQNLELLNSVDELVIMAYDFHRPGMDFAGAVAPIKTDPGERSIWEVVEKINNSGLDKKKIVMAYPLYGYEWKTYSEEYGSAIKRGWYQMASWKRVKELLQDNVETKSAKWDELSMSPWMSFEKDGQIHQIYYEDSKSLAIKLDLVKQGNFGGVGFWALGYEGNDETLWRMINN